MASKEEEELRIEKGKPIIIILGPRNISET